VTVFHSFHSSSAAFVPMFDLHALCEFGLCVLVCCE